MVGTKMMTALDATLIVFGLTVLILKSGWLFVLGLFLLFLGLILFFGELLLSLITEKIKDIVIKMVKDSALK